MADSFIQALERSKVVKKQKKDGLALIERLALKPGLKVLDLGCGNGIVTQVLAEKVQPGEVVAIDSQSRVDIAKKYFAADNVEYAAGGEGHIPGENYDLVFSNYFLHWVRDNEALFKNVAEKINSGGRFAFIMLGVVTQEMIDEHLGWASDQFKQGFVSRLKGLGVSDVEELAEKNNFEATDVYTDTYALDFDNVEEYIDNYLVHGGLTKDMFDENKIKEFYGSERVKMNLTSTVAILRKK